MAEELITVSPGELRERTIERLTSADIAATDAEIVADVLVFADMRGTHSHGVMRVAHYAERARSGGLNLEPLPEPAAIKPAVARLDARGGIGHVAARRATEHAIALAQQHGIALVGVQNSSHCGALSYYVNMALEQKMVAFVVANTDAIVVPFGGRDAFFGTNPFAFGLPGETDSMLLDMATSEVALGKILLAREKKTSIPTGWAVTADGDATTDPNAAASLFPFAGHKGYGINMMVEALTGVLIGGVFGPHLKPMYAQLDTLRDLSSFHLVIDPTLFLGDAVYSIAQRMMDELHRQRPAAGTAAVKLPGEIEAEAMRRALTEGVSIPRSVYEYLISG